MAVRQEFQVSLEFLVPRDQSVWRVPEKTIALRVQLVQRETRAIQEVKVIPTPQAPGATQGPWKVAGNSACLTV